MKAETEEQIKERWFATLVRAYFTDILRGVKPALGLMEITAEFDFSNGAAARIRSAERRKFVEQLTDRKLDKERRARLAR